MISIYNRIYTYIKILHFYYTFLLHYRLMLQIFIKNSSL